MSSQTPNEVIPLNRKDVGAILAALESLSHDDVIGALHVRGGLTLGAARALANKLRGQSPQYSARRSRGTAPRLTPAQTALLQSLPADPKASAPVRGQQIRTARILSRACLIRLVSILPDGHYYARMEPGR